MQRAGAEQQTALRAQLQEAYDQAAAFVEQAEAGAEPYNHTPCTPCTLQPAPYTLNHGPHTLIHLER